MQSLQISETENIWIDIEFPVKKTSQRDIGKNRKEKDKSRIAERRRKGVLAWRTQSTSRFLIIKAY